MRGKLNEIDCLIKVSKCLLLYRRNSFNVETSANETKSDENNIFLRIIVTSFEKLKLCQDTFSGNSTAGRSSSILCYNFSSLIGKKSRSVQKFFVFASTIFARNISTLIFLILLLSSASSAGNTLPHSFQQEM